MLYYLYEMNHAALAPWRAAADAGLSFWKSPSNPLASTQMGRSMAASLEMFERGTRRYGKPAFEITDTILGDDLVAVEEVEALQKDFCTRDQLPEAVDDSPGQARAQAADRGAHVRPLCHAAARHGGSHAAALRRLHHRLDRCPDRAAEPRQLRSR